VNFMRLDKFLKVSRIIKRRTIANKACDAQRISVNGRPARASYEVKLGDILEISLGGHQQKIEVTDVSEYTTKEGASSLYRVIVE
jgi:ribosomal 50S subunit-recycling heat shock protein